MTSNARIGWSIVAFALVVAVVAFALLGAPGVDHGLATKAIPHTLLSRRDWMDMGIGAVFTLLAAGVAAVIVTRTRAARRQG
jgi:hypothetical protein